MSRRKPNQWLSLVIWLLPSSGVKLWLLRRLGNRIGRDVSIGPTLVLGCGPFSLADGATISNFNVFRRLAGVDMGPSTFIGNFNQFTAAAEYQQFSELVGRLIMRHLSVITNRHYLDCSGQVILKDYAGVGGIRSILQSHEIDLQDDRTTIGRVIVGERAMTATGCILLRDSHLPDRSVLAAGSLLTKVKPGVDMPVSALYGGVPARLIQQVSGFEWWKRDSYNTPVTAFDDSKFALD